MTKGIILVLLYLIGARPIFGLSKCIIENPFKQRGVILKLTKKEKYFSKLLEQAKFLINLSTLGDDKKSSFLKMSRPFEDLMNIWIHQFSYYEVAQSILVLNRRGDLCQYVSKGKKLKKKFIKLEDIIISDGLTLPRFSTYEVRQGQFCAKKDCDLGLNDSYESNNLSEVLLGSEIDDLNYLERSLIKENPLAEQILDEQTKDETRNQFYKNWDLLHYIINQKKHLLKYLFLNPSGKIIIASTINSNYYIHFHNTLSAIMRQAWGNLISAQQGMGGLSQDASLKELSDLFAFIQKLLQKDVITFQTFKDLTLVNKMKLRLLLGNFLVDPNEETKMLRQNRIEFLEDKAHSNKRLDGGGNENGTHDARKVIFKIKEPDKKDEVILTIRKKFHDNVHHKMGGINEIITVMVDLYYHHLFNVPLAMIKEDRNELCTIHVYAGQCTSAFKWLHLYQNKPETLDQNSVHHLILLSLLVGSEDGHLNNVLVDSQSKLIPIDFGRALSPEPLNPYTQFRFTGFMELGHLDKKANSYLTDLLISTSPSDLGTLLYDTLKDVEYFSDKEKYLTQLNYKMDHLMANLIFIQEALKANLTVKELITFKMPLNPLTVQNRYLEFDALKSKMLRGKKDKNEMLKNSTRDIFRNKIYIQYEKLIPLWNRAYKKTMIKDNLKLNQDYFRQLIRKYIQKYKELSEREKFLYFFHPAHLELFGHFYL